MPSTCEATVFYDDAGEASARIYALAAPTVDGRLLTVDELAECRLECRVEGPKCRYSTTLPTRVKLTHRGVTNWGDLPAVMAEADLPDPCHWSPELPFLYRVIGELRLGEQVIAEIDQTFGIRPISVVRNRIKFQGKTWVPRIVRKWIVDPIASLEQWHESATVMSAIEPSDELCNEASAVGVFLFAGVRHGDGFDSPASLRRLSRYPAVAIALIESEAPLLAAIRESARNTLLSSWQVNVPDSQVVDATDVFIGTTFNSGSEGNLWSSNRPIFAFSELKKKRSLEDARSACDSLQSRLAGKLDPAGYIV